MLAPDPAAVAAAERIRAQAGARVHRLGEPDELTEEAMPRGVYDRTKKASKPAEPNPDAEAKPAKKKPGRKAKAKPEKAARKPRAKLVTEHVAGPRFGVFDDGSVTLNLPECKGQIAPVEAREFLGFLAKIGVKA